MSQSSFSEKEMAKAFMEWLDSSASSGVLPDFASVLPEVTCRQGIADFVAAEGSRPVEMRIEESLDGYWVSDTACIHVLSALRFSAPRRGHYIAQATGFSHTTTRRILSRLVAERLVDQRDTGAYVLSEMWRNAQLDMWAFELKLRDWHRALYQAMQYRAFATRVVTVFPKERERILRKNLRAFKKMKVGIMLFDANTQICEVLLKPRKTRPFSRTHYLFALRQMILRSSAECVPCREKMPAQLIPPISQSSPVSSPARQ